MILYFDGSKCNDGARGGSILISPVGEKTILACKLEFECTNMMAEYEALVQGLHKSIILDVEYLRVSSASSIVIKQVRNNIHCVSNHLRRYQSLIQILTSHFIAFNISPIPRLQNASDDLLANVGSKLIPPRYFSPDKFSIEFIFHPSIPNNITQW